MVRKRVGDVYTRTIKLDHEHPRRVEKKSVEMEHLWIYATGEAVYFGNQSEQAYMIAAQTTHITTYALDLRNVDLADLWVRADPNGSTAYVHLIGTLKVGKE